MVKGKEDIMNDITKDSWRNKFVKKNFKKFVFVYVILRIKESEIKMVSHYRKIR